MKKIKVLIFSVVLIIGLTAFASPLLAVSPVIDSNASHVANCATEMGGQHVASCAQAMEKGVSECAQMKGSCNH
jgi:hypothetical protein